MPLVADPGRLPRRQVAAGLLLAVLLCALFSGALWWFHERARDHLDQALGLRLQQVAATAAATVPGDSLLVWWLAEEEPVELLLLQRRLERVELDNQLSRIVLYQVDQTVVVDTGQLLDRGEVDPFLALDLASVEQALSGLPSWSRLQETGGIPLKAGYAPVLDSYGDVAGFVGVVGSAGFLGTLAELRRTLLLTGAVVCAVVVLLTLAWLAYARRLARARAALQRSENLSAMGRMAAGIAHEIRNPLGIIKNTAQLLREDLEEAGLPTDMVDFIPQEVDRLDETLTGYLEFARESPLRLERVDLVRLLRRTARVMGPDLDHAGVQLVDRLGELGQLVVVADPRRLQQVALNLLLNAVQAMAGGGKLTLSAQAAGDELRVEIADTGPGIPAQELAKVFEPFVTSREQGSGLGLPTVKRIVEEHGGSIRLLSEPGRGTTAVLRLPVAGPAGRGA